MAGLRPGSARARSEGSCRAVDLPCHQLGRHGDLRDLHDRWSAKFGADADGAVPIRPDGFIA
jgi:hypothetical protein